MIKMKLFLLYKLYLHFTNTRRTCARDSRGLIFIIFILIYGIYIEFEKLIKF